MTPASAQQAVQVDPAVPSYQAVSGISGNLNSIGSDTLNNVMTMWAEGFKKFYPNVNIQIEGKGSGTAPPALIEGTAQLGPMSRPMKGSEIGKSAANKIIQGDWPWYADRDKKDPWSQWHNYKGQYRFNMLWGDGHTDFFNFPPDAYKWNYGGPPPDPNFAWW